MKQASPLTQAHPLRTLPELIDQIASQGYGLSLQILQHEYRFEPYKQWQASATLPDATLQTKGATPLEALDALYTRIGLLQRAQMLEEA